MDHLCSSGIETVVIEKLARASALGERILRLPGKRQAIVSRGVSIQALIPELIQGDNGVEEVTIISMRPHMVLIDDVISCVSETAAQFFPKA